MFLFLFLIINSLVYYYTNNLKWFHSHRKSADQILLNSYTTIMFPIYYYHLYTISSLVLLHYRIWYIQFVPICIDASNHRGGVKYGGKGKFSWVTHHNNFRVTYKRYVINLLIVSLFFTTVKVCSIFQVCASSASTYIRELTDSCYNWCGEIIIFDIRTWWNHILLIIIDNNIFTYHCWFIFWCW